MLLAALGSAKPALIGSGHVHQFVSHDRWSSHDIWAPSTGFILPAASQPHYGLKQTGYVEHACSIRMAVIFPDLSRFAGSPRPAHRFPHAYAQYAAPAKPNLGTQHRLAHPDQAAVGDVVTKPIARRRKGPQDGSAVLKPAQLIALLKARRAGHQRCTIAVAFEGKIKKTQSNTCDQHRSNGNQRHRALVAVELQG